MGVVTDFEVLEQVSLDHQPDLVTQETVIGTSRVRYHEVNRSRGPSAHFYGANGFPATCYRPLLCDLSHHFSLTAMENRALWPGTEPTSRVRCRDYADDLIAYLEQRYTQPIIGIGHSMGATTTLMAAAKRPDLFRRLVLIEPVIQSVGREWLTRLMPARLARRFEPIRSALSAPDRWSSTHDAFVDFRSRRAFRRMDDAQLESLVQGLTEPFSGGVRLAFGRDWEVRNYLALDAIWRDLNALRTPVRVIHGKPSLFLTPQILARLEQTMPQWEFICDKNYGHLLPLEAPERTADLIQQPPASP